MNEADQEIGWRYNHPSANPQNSPVYDRILQKISTSSSLHGVYHWVGVSQSIYLRDKVDTKRLRHNHRVTLNWPFDMSELKIKSPSRFAVVSRYFSERQ
jgi:hypothetical protein